MYAGSIAEFIDVVGELPAHADMIFDRISTLDDYEHLVDSPMAC